MTDLKTFETADSESPERVSAKDAPLPLGQRFTNRIAKLFRREVPPSLSRKIAQCLNAENPFGQNVRMQEGAPAEPENHLKALMNWRGLLLRGVATQGIRDDKKWEEEMWLISDIAAKAEEFVGETDKLILARRRDDALKFLKGVRALTPETDESVAREVWSHRNDWVAMRDLNIVLREA